MKPLRLKPVYIPAIWAGNRLRKIRNLQEESIGISREVCAYRSTENIIAEGEFAGKSIKELIENYHQELMGSDTSDQLVRAAYIDAIDDLSIQVHPTEDYARECGDYEKSEAWYILEAEAGAYITAGTTIKDKEKLRQAAEQGVIEQYVCKIPVQVGDFALIPAGMLHACGKNMLAIEIGSFGGITYRLSDYGRGRALDLEKGFAVLNPDLTCSITKHPLPETPINQIKVGVDHSLFHVDVIDIAEEMEFKLTGHYTILTCVKGKGWIYHDGERYPLNYTQTMLIPADIQSYKILGNLRILYAYHPIMP